MGKFHRFVAPTYYGAPVLPAGPSTVAFEGSQYNLFNVVSAGVGAGGSAFMDDAKAAGPNTGTYAVAFGEDASSSNANRGLKALAENTDLIDDILHRDLALPVRTNVVTPVAPVTTIALAAGTYVGHSLTYPLDMLFDLVDGQDREIFNPTTGAKIRVASISGATIGDGFTAGVVTLNLTEAIPIGQQYRLYYASRGNVATLPVDALTFIKVRGAQEIAAEVESIFNKIQAPSSVGQPWNGTPYTTLYDTAWGGLNERAKRASARDGSAPAYHPVAPALDTAGSGAWFEKLLGTGVTGYSSLTGTNVTGSFGNAPEHALGAVWAAVVTDTVTNGGTGYRASGTSGFVALGNWTPSPSSAGRGSPALFSFYAGARKAGGLLASSRTFLGTNQACTMSGAVLTLGGSHFFTRNEGGDDKSNVVVGMDIFRVSVAGVVYSVVPVEILTSTTCRVRFIDGSIPNFTPGPATFVEWIQTSFFASDGASSYWDNIIEGGSSDVQLKGLVWAVPPRANSTDDQIEEHARFFGSNVLSDGGHSTGVALAWGGYDHGSFGYIERGQLFSDGSAFFQGKITATAGIDVNGTGLNVTAGTSTFTSLVTFSGVRAHFDAGFVTADVTEFGAELNIGGGVKHTSWQATGAGAAGATVDCSTVSHIELLLDNYNPAGGTASQLNLTLNNVISGSFNAGRVVVVVRRRSSSRLNTVNFITPGGVTSVIDASDAQLSPITGGGTYWYDVYEGTVVSGTVFWKVSRHRA